MVYLLDAEYARAWKSDSIRRENYDKLVGVHRGLGYGYFVQTRAYLQVMREAVSTAFITISKYFNEAFGNQLLVPVRIHEQFSSIQGLYWSVVIMNDRFECCDLCFRHLDGGCQHDPFDTF